MRCAGLAVFVVSAAALLVASLARAAEEQTPEAADAEVRAVLRGLRFRQGTIQLRGELATLRVPNAMQFLDGRDAATVIDKLWHNAPGTEPLGMLIPKGCDLLGDCWAFIITYEEEGHVDADAAKLDARKLLREMQRQTRAASKERETAGKLPVELVGWAKAPRYYQSTHKLVWATTLRSATDSEGDTIDSVSYNIRLLGRRGVLVLQAAARTDRLAALNTAASAILPGINFNPGHRYADYSASADEKAAAHGVRALITRSLQER